MFSFFIKRALYAIPVLFTVATAVFFLSHAIPGNPVDIILGEQALPADRERLSEQLNLDKPIALQYVYFLKGLVKGQWGQSLFDRKDVMTLIKERYPLTLHLAGASRDTAP